VPRCSFSVSRSKRVWRLSQNGSVVPGVSRQAQRGVDGDAALAVNALVDPPWWHADCDGEPVLGDPEGLQELLHEDFAVVDPSRLRFAEYYVCAHASITLA